MILVHPGVTSIAWRHFNRNLRRRAVNPTAYDMPRGLVPGECTLCLSLNPAFLGHIKATEHILSLVKLSLIHQSSVWEIYVLVLFM